MRALQDVRIPFIAVLLVTSTVGCDGPGTERDEPPRSAPRASRAITIVTLDGSKRAPSGTPRASPEPAAASDERQPDETPRTFANGNILASSSPASSTEALDPAPATGHSIEPVSRGGDTPSEDGGELLGGGEEPARGAWAASMRKLVRDLEFNAGLPEPLQQNVVASPAPWTPPPDAESNPVPTIDGVFPVTGRASGGEPVTIRGRNLRPAQILFGMVPATIVQQREDRVVVVAPPSGPGEAPIVVTNRDGNYAIAASAFRYVR